MAQMRKNGLCRRPMDFIRNRTTRLLLSVQLIGPAQARARQRAASGMAFAIQTPEVRRRARGLSFRVGQSHFNSVSTSKSAGRGGPADVGVRTVPGVLRRVIVRGVLGPPGDACALPSLAACG